MEWGREKEEERKGIIRGKGGERKRRGWGEERKGEGIGNGDKGERKATGR